MTHNFSCNTMELQVVIVLLFPYWMYCLGLNSSYVVPIGSKLAFKCFGSFLCNDKTYKNNKRFKNKLSDPVSLLT